MKSATIFLDEIQSQVGGQVSIVTAGKEIVVNVWWEDIGHGYTHKFSKEDIRKLPDDELITARLVRDARQTRQKEIHHG